MSDPDVRPEDALAVAQRALAKSEFVRRDLEEIDEDLDALERRIGDIDD